MKLEEKIMLLRKQKGWSQEELAFRLDVSRQAVSKWEMGTCIPDLDKIIKMSELFEVTIDCLVKEECVELSSTLAIKPKAKIAPTKKKINISKEQWMKITCWTSVIISFLCILTVLVVNTYFQKTQGYLFFKDIFKYNAIVLLAKLIIVALISKCDKKLLIAESIGLVISQTLYFPFRCFNWVSLFPGMYTPYLVKYFVWFQINLGVYFIAIAIWKKNILYGLNALSSVCCLFGIIGTEAVAAEVLTFACIWVVGISLMLIQVKKNVFDLKSKLLLLILFLIIVWGSYLGLDFTVAKLFDRRACIYTTYSLFLVLCVVIQMTVTFLIKKENFIKKAFSHLPLLYILNTISTMLLFVSGNIFSSYYEMFFMYELVFYVMICNLVLGFNIKNKCTEK